MTKTIVTKTIKAPPEVIFRALSDVALLPRVIPEVVKTELLSATKTGVGTRFRETRMTNGREMETVLEVTEFVQDERIRMVADSHGTVWDSVFTLKTDGWRTELQLVMEAKGYRLMAKIMNLLFQSLYRRGIERHLDAVRDYCES